MTKHQSTHERSPQLAESNLPTSRQQNKLPLLANHPWLMVVGVGMLSVVIAAMAIFSLTNTGRVEKDPAKQTTVATQKQPTAKSNWLPTIIFLGAGTGAIALYKLRSRLPNFSGRGLTRRQQRKLSLQQGKNTAATVAPKTNQTAPVPEPIVEDQSVEAVLMDVTPTIAVLPPETERSNHPDGQSLAEMMDIRKHLSLSAILQDFKRPD